RAVRKAGRLQGHHRAKSMLDHPLATKRGKPLSARVRRYPQSALMPVNLTTLPHFSVSSAISLPKSAGEPAITLPLRSASRVFMLGSARPALISLFSFSTISAGVTFGAPTPYHVLAS